MGEPSLSDVIFNWLFSMMAVVGIIATALAIVGGIAYLLS